jgi:hypothetical protein
MLADFFDVYHPVFVFGYRFIGFMCGYLLLGWVRRVVLFYVKAAHIVALVKLIMDIPVKQGQGQVSDGFSLVFKKFFSSTVFFGADILVNYGLGEISSYIMNKDVLPSVGILGFFTKWFGKVLRVSLSYSDEIVLSYIFYCELDDTPDNDGKFLSNVLGGIVLYVQCAVKLLKAAFYSVLSVEIFSVIGQLVAVWILVGFLNVSLVTAIAVYFAFRFALSGVSFVLLEPYETTSLLIEFYSSVGAIDESQDDSIVDKLRGISSKFNKLVNRVLGSGSKDEQRGEQGSESVIDMRAVVDEVVGNVKDDILR